MPISRNSVTALIVGRIEWRAFRLHYALLVLIFTLALQAQAALISGSGSNAIASPKPKKEAGASPIHWSADKTVWNRKQHLVELYGHAIVKQPGEVLNADAISLDLTTREMVARDNCIYVTADEVIYGDEMDFNLDTRTGTIVSGRVANDRFSLSGARINKLSDTRFQTFRGTYTTCHDCPASWTLEGEDIDLEVEGYAFMTNVTSRIDDAPFFWMPYMVVPIKTKRQTGLLFPKMGFSNGSFHYVQPFFWAINRSSDMTFAAGDYGDRGARVEWEGRYSLANGSGTANLYYIHDSNFRNIVQVQEAQNGQPIDYSHDTPNRWALKSKQKQKLPWHIDEKLQIQEVKDNLYPSEFGQVYGDLPSNGAPYLTSQLFFQHTTDQVSTYVEAQRTRNLLYPNIYQFDPNTVQVYPTAGMAANDIFFFGGPIAGGLSLGVTNFSRTAGLFDADQFNPRPIGSPAIPGTDPIRKAVRFNYNPTLYTTLRPFGIFSVVPYAQWRGYYYEFQQGIPSLSRGYLQAKTDISTQVERVYESDDPLIPRFKHLFRPILSYSVIPVRYQTFQGQSASHANHPFLQQMSYAQNNNFSGYNFDDQDVVPLDGSNNQVSDYFYPLGNAVSAGFTTQLIRRKGEIEAEYPSYQTSVELNATESYNLRANRPGNSGEPLSRFDSNLIFQYDKWTSTSSYSYYPYAAITDSQDRNVISSSFGYQFAKALHQRILNFERNFSLGFYRNTIGTPTDNLNGAVTYSLNDYIMPTFNASHDFESGKWSVLMVDLVFQSPSRCWKLEVKGTRQLTPLTPAGFSYDYGVDFALNLTGSGFGNVSDAPSSLGAH